MALVVPVGGHPESWVARVHLASPFADGPLVIVDCSHPREKPLERWSESDDGPVDAALGGTLVLRGAHALPHETQRYIVAALRKETGLVVTVPDTLDALAAAGFIEKNLVDRVGPRQIELPGLANRAEDLGHLTDHQLERIATELGRERLGVSLEARQVISEYHWPGNETEFAAVLLRAAMVCESGDLDAELLESILGSTVVPPAVKR